MTNSVDLSLRGRLIEVANGLDLFLNVGELSDWVRVHLLGRLANMRYAVHDVVSLLSDRPGTAKQFEDYWDRLMVGVGQCLMLPSEFWPSLSSLQNRARLMRQFVRLLLEEVESSPVKQECLCDHGKQPACSGGKRLGDEKKKKSSSAGAAIIAALIQHHQYEAGGGGSCLQFEPIRVRQLAKSAGVSVGSVSGFFTCKFGCHKRYTEACIDGQRLIASLIALNGDLIPSILWNNLSYEIADPRSL